MALGLLIISRQFQEFIPTTAHPWCDIHSISINIVECGGTRAGVQVSRKKFYAYIHLNYARVEFYLVFKKKKKKVYSEKKMYHSPLILAT